MNELADQRLSQICSDDLVTSLGFRRVEGIVRLVDEIFGVLALQERGDAAAERQVDAGLSVERKIHAVELCLDTVEEDLGLLGIGVGQDDGELVAADAGEDIFLAQVHA